MSLQKGVSSQHWCTCSQIPLKGALADSLSSMGFRNLTPPIRQTRRERQVPAPLPVEEENSQMESLAPLPKTDGWILHPTRKIKSPSTRYGPDSRHFLKSQLQCYLLRFLSIPKSTHHYGDFVAMSVEIGSSKPDERPVQIWKGMVEPASPCPKRVGTIKQLC